MISQHFCKRNNKLINQSKIVISYSFRGFEVFLKVPVIIINRFGENNVFWPIYLDFGDGKMVSLTFTRLIFIKTEKYKNMT